MLSKHELDFTTNKNISLIIRQTPKQSKMNSDNRPIVQAAADSPPSPPMVNHDRIESIVAEILGVFDQEKAAREKKRLRE